MGSGPTIEQLAEKEQAFRTYLAQIRKELEKDKEKDTSNLDGIIKKYYSEGGWSYQPIMQTDKVDVQQVSSWSLDNVVKMLNGVRDAIFGNSTPPDGVEIEKPEGLSQSLGQLEDLKLLALNRAFAAVQGILETFATQTSFRGQALTKVELVAPGMTLFVSIRSDTWRNQGFFNNDSIAQYLYILRSYFSLEQAGDISKYNDLLAYEELKASYRTRMFALAQKIADPATSFAAVVELEQELGYYSNQISAIQATIDDLQKKEIAEQLQFARTAIASRRAKLAAQ